MRLYPQETADLVMFTEEYFNRKLHFCAVFLIEMHPTIRSRLLILTEITKSFKIVYVLNLRTI